jgi:hypothetical protein
VAAQPVEPAAVHTAAVPGAARFALEPAVEPAAASAARSARQVVPQAAPALTRVRTNHRILKFPAPARRIRNKTLPLNITSFFHSLQFFCCAHTRLSINFTFVFLQFTFLNATLYMC